MKKLLVALVLMLSSSAFAQIDPIELNEADSKEMYNVLAKWGTRWVDREENRIEIWVDNPRCILSSKDQKEIECTLFDRLHNSIERSRSDKAAWLLARLLVRHVEPLCENRNENGTCVIEVHRIRCEHPLDPKNPSANFGDRLWICSIDLIPPVRVNVILPRKFQDASR